MAIDKARENRLRRWAERLGYELHKDRARTWGIHHQGEYMIHDRARNVVVAGQDFDATLDEVESHLAEIEQSLRSRNRKISNV